MANIWQTNRLKNSKPTNTGLWLPRKIGQIKNNAGNRLINLHITLEQHELNIEVIK